VGKFHSVVESGHPENNRRNYYKQHRKNSCSL